MGHRIVEGVDPNQQSGAQNQQSGWRILYTGTVRIQFIKGNHGSNNRAKAKIFDNYFLTRKINQYGFKTHQQKWKINTLGGMFSNLFLPTFWEVITVGDFHNYSETHRNLENCKSLISPKNLPQNIDFQLFLVCFDSHCLDFLVNKYI